MRLSLALFVLGLSAILIASRLRPRMVTSEPTPAPSAAASAQVIATPVAERPEVIPSSDSPKTEFGRWLRDEARQLDEPSAAGKESEMAAVAAKLTPVETRELLRTAKSTHAPAAEKILSTYLLVQAGPRAIAELQELIATPISEGGPAHSDSELNRARDKTLRIMALDGLSTRAQSDPMARAALARSVDAIEDPFVKKYARERLERLSR